MKTRWIGTCAAVLLSTPLLTGSAAAETTAHYVCGDSGVSFGATFRDDGDTLVLEFAGSPPATLRSAISGSGFRYVGQGYEFHGKADDAVFTQPGRTPVSCRAAAAPSGGSAGVAAPPPPRPSFDCAKARAPSEVAICKSAGLAEMDLRMTKAYGELRGRVRGRKRRSLRKSQKRWLRKRNACGDNLKCLESAYLERIAALQRWR